MGFLIAIVLAGCGGDDDEPGTGGAGGDAPRAAEEKRSGQGEGDARDAPRDDRKRPEQRLSTEAQIDLAIKGVLASGVPGLACSRYATPRHVKAAFGSRAGCVQSTVPGSAASAVEVRKVEIRGEEATAVALPAGGPSGGERIEVALVREAGLWKVDRLRSNAPVGP